MVRRDGRAGDALGLLQTLGALRGARVTYDDPVRRSLVVRVDLGDTGYEVEVGRATVEAVLPPARDLTELEAISARALPRLIETAAASGMLLLGYGIQPRTPKQPALMTPKRRYLTLYRAIGRPWLHFATTASDQVQVDIARAELVDAINMMNLLSAPIIALSANSSVYGGRVGRYCSGREGLLGTLGAGRHGMTPRRFATVEEFVEFISGQTCYMLPRDRGFAAYRRPFTNYLAMHGADLRAYLWHEHYTWNSARPRFQNATIEVRPACQQPPDEPLAAAALILGLVEAMTDAWTFLRDRLGPDPWPVMQAYRRAVVRDGLRAPEPVRGVLSGLVDLAEAALQRRGSGEERYLNPIRDRLERRSLPADRAASRFRSGGIEALIENLRM